MRQIAQGPLLQTYPLVRADQGPPKPPEQLGSLLSEGDSPSYWFLLPIGLRSEEDPSWGGWGGRFTKIGRAVWTDQPKALSSQADTVRDNVPFASTDALAQAAPLTRWIPALQNDFLARSRWTVSKPDAANHEPVVHVAPRQRSILVRPDQRLTISVQAADPDGDSLTCRWWQYREAGTYSGAVSLEPATSALPSGSSEFSAQLTVPKDARVGDTIHLIAEVSDAGAPPLTRYARIILTVR